MTLRRRAALDDADRQGVRRHGRRHPLIEADAGEQQALYHRQMAGRRSGADALAVLGRAGTCRSRS